LCGPDSCPARAFYSSGVIVKRLGASPHLYCSPLTHGLRAERWCDIAFDGTAQNALKLRSRLLHAALLSPIDYARSGSEYHLVPDLAISSVQGTGTIALHFREGIHAVRTVAADPSSAGEIVLASIVLAEAFDVEASIVPMEGGLDAMLAHADAALLVGNSALRAAPYAQNAVDLVEEWHEMTGLPYVHALWCGREHDLLPVEREALRRVRDRGVQGMEEIAAGAFTTPGFPPRTAQDLRGYLDAFSYDLTDEVAEGFREFLQYAYYHGVIPDVPEMNFYPAEGEISLN
jgi:chorismate dehydratase